MMIFIKIIFQFHSFYEKRKGIRWLHTDFFLLTPSLSTQTLILQSKPLHAVQKKPKMTERSCALGFTE